MRRKRLVLAPDVDEEDSDDSGVGRSGVASYTASLITQGRHRFYTLSMPSDVLAETCVVDTRDQNPIDGFQRVLDRRRAQDIANYIDAGLGTILSAIVLSAQPEAHLQYSRRTRTLSFRKSPRAFLIIDGQHRVFGFHLATARLRVPVVIYNNLGKSEEARLFIDINTKQRPVPNELLLDIKRMAETETDVEALLRDVFDLFDDHADSALAGLLAPSERRKGKISRVTFNAALKAIWQTIEGSDAEGLYNISNAYLHAWLAGLRELRLSENLTNPTLFRAIMLLFPMVAERVSDRFGEFTTDAFGQVLGPFFARLKKSDLKQPGSSPVALHEVFKKALQSGFSIRVRQ